MGRSYTYHVLGYARRPTDPPETHELMPAMNRVEISQQREKARRRGLSIVYWAAQTKTGERILGGTDWAPDPEVPGARVVSCPICDSRGCIVCDWSGVCPPNHWKRWQPWQLEAIRRES